MSQFFIQTSAGGGGSSVIEIDTQLGNATPIAGIIIANGEQSTENNNNGIITNGGVAGTGVQNEVEIVLTNRSTAQATTANDTLTTIHTFSLGATPGVYSVDGMITAYNITDGTGGSYPYQFAAHTTGTPLFVGTELGSEFSNVFEPASMLAISVEVTISGNNLIVRVEGLAEKTINWDSFLTYRFVS